MTTIFIREQIESPVGAIDLVTEEDGTVRMCEFADKPDRTASHLRCLETSGEIRPGKTPGPAREALKAYFTGDVTSLDDLPVAADGTAFRQKVWAALRTIPAGETWSYGDLAAAIGNPKGSRAVGNANGANPIALIVPCHRVIATGGKLGGYGGGLDRKRWLLRHEAAYCGNQLSFDAG